MLHGFAKRVGISTTGRTGSDDFEALKKAGYLTINVPKELGGRGYSLAETVLEQRRIAYHGAGDGARREHAPLLGWYRRRPVARW